MVAKELRLSDPYMRAMVNYLAGGASWELTINDPDLPLLDRTVLAIRFVNDASVSFVEFAHASTASDTVYFAALCISG